jgi:uncharacterized protein YlaI
MKTAFFRTEAGHIKFDSKGARNRYASCERKQGLTLFDANKIIKKQALKKTFLRTYLCNTCGKWHLTHTKQ